MGDGFVINERISKLRELMKKENLSAFIIPSSDNHQSEYVGDYFKSREFMSGFTGSAGTLVVTLKEAGLWTDGRYHLQASREINGTEVKLFKMGNPGVISYTTWIKESLEKGETVGFNGLVFSLSQYKNLCKDLNPLGIEVRAVSDLIDDIWEGRPTIPCDEIFDFDIKYSGESRVSKLERIRKVMEEKRVSKYVISSLDDIAWVTNLRGNDVRHNPVFLSYLVIGLEETALYVDKCKVSKELESILNKDGIAVKPYDEVFEDLKVLDSKESFYLDGEKTNVSIFDAINKESNIVEERNVTTDFKAIKNKVEIENFIKCHIKDGRAMVRFIYWLKNTIGKEEITEISASDKLEKFRSEEEDFKGISFDSISAYEDNAAMLHYKAKEESNAKLSPRGFYLIDSGGQYLDGTTDITRTISLGDITEEQREDFTLVLKGHIALAKAVFLRGATGHSLDILARGPIWEKGLDYRCGTGHGVGFFLNIHEGPQGIRKEQSSITLEEGMILTNEPGIYKDGKHGIRTENLHVIEKVEENDYGTFLRFNTITYCPIELDVINKDLLSQDEILWLNNYHKEVYDVLSPILEEEEKNWLKEATRSI